MRRDEVADDPAVVLDYVRGQRLLDPTRHLVVMVSGGRDSVCLLDVAVVLCGADRVHALHVNYAMRPGAREDERHCRALCERLGVALEVARPRRPAGGAGNLQAWAREVRYARARRLARRHGALIAAGHTASDQVETILYRLAASPGRRALLGMAPSDGLLVRPLLGVTRQQTAAYCVARGLAWREDPTNDTDQYARGRVRHGVVAALREVHPAAEDNVLRTAALLRAEAGVLDELVSGALDGNDSIALPRLAALPVALARLVLVRLAEDAGRQPLPSVAGRLDELLALGGRGGSATLDLGAGVRAVVEYGVLRMSAQPLDDPPAAVSLEVPGRARFGAWELDCAIASAKARGRRGEGMLDADALGGAVLVRPWRAGDRVAPPGVPGTKTLADLFTDRRIPRSQRQTMPVVEAGGRIAWVPGVTSDRRFSVTDRTRRAARLRARRIVARRD